MAWGTATRAALARNPHEPAEEFVYFIHARERGLFKIGRARNPFKRLRFFRTSSPDHLALVGLLAGGQELEQELHQEFADDRVRGEWFETSERLRALIAAAHQAATGSTIAERIAAGPVEAPRRRRKWSEVSDLLGITEAAAQQAYGWVK